MNDDMIFMEPILDDYEIPQEPLQVEPLPEQQGRQKS